MKKAWKVVGILVLIAAAVAAMGAVIMGLWNWLLPTLFVGAHSIDFWQAIGLLVLCRILFGGFRGHHGWRGRWHRGHGGKMTPEERDSFKEKMRAFRDHHHQHHQGERGQDAAGA